uniref:Uncharacterized protein n=1 Tax=Zea mays TaxID=4577 RepID=C0HIN2_MAIZE|nr:unknown [Zea mays]
MEHESHLDVVELVVVDRDGLALQAAELEGGELLRHVLVAGRLLEADVGVGPGPGERAEDGAQEVDPEAGVEVARQRRPQRPRRVHRSARHCPCEDGRNANRGTNCQPRQLTHRSRVRGDGEGDEHHVEGDDDLDDERVPVRPRRRGGAQHGDGVQHGLEHERRADAAGELRRPVERDLDPGEMAEHGERERDGGVHVRARDVSDGVDHDGDDEPAGDRLPQLRDAVLVAAVDPRRPARDEHQQERGHHLRDHLLEEVRREDVRQRPVVVRGGHAGVLRRADVMDLVVEVGPGVGPRVGRHFRPAVDRSSYYAPACCAWSS